MIAYSCELVCTNKSRENRFLHLYFNYETHLWNSFMKLIYETHLWNYEIRPKICLLQLCLTFLMIEESMIGKLVVVI